MTNTFREHLQRAISETFDLWDISSEWWENMTWPTKRQRQRQIQRQWQWQIHLEPSKSDLWDFWPFRHLIRVARKQDLANKKTTTKTMTMANTFGEHFQRAIFETKIICFFLEWSIDARSKFLDLVQSQNLNILLYEANIGRGESDKVCWVGYEIFWVLAGVRGRAGGVPGSCPVPSESEACLAPAHQLKLLCLSLCKEHNRPEHQGPQLAVSCMDLTKMPVYTPEDFIQVTPYVKLGIGYCIAWSWVALIHWSDPEWLM